jgi:Rad3-related DNA helicase
VAPLIRRRLKAPTTVSLSAMIGRPDLFGYESGIKDEFFSAPSTFPIENRRIYLPADVEDLSRSSDPSGRKKTKTLRQIAKGCRRLVEKGVRSLVLVISNAERAKFMQMAREEGVEALSYTEEVLAKDAALKFKDGTGEVLCGCVAHYGIGVDFPKETAGAVWLLRPGYPNPDSAATQFEMQRFGEGHYWSRLVYRVMLEAQQAVGRNIRGPRDKGVCFLMSLKFEDFVYSGLPDWLKPAYRHGLMLDECLEDTRALLS